MPDEKEFLHRFPALGAYLPGLHGAEASALIGALVERNAAQGEVLLAEGSNADTIFLVWEGSVVVTIGDPPDVLEVGRPGTGAVVGEVSFLDGGPASATVKVAEASRLYTIDRARFEALRAAHPRAATALLRALCRTIAGRLRSATDQLQGLVGEKHVAAAPHQPRGLLDAFRALLGLRSEP